MPPKRKRANDVAEPSTSTSTRATRSSTKTTKDTKKDQESRKPAASPSKKSSAKASKIAVDAQVEDSDELAPPTKKTKTKASTTVKLSRGEKQIPAKKALGDDFPEKSPPKTVASEVPLTTSEVKVLSNNKPKPSPSSPVKTSYTKTEPYSLQRATVLFQEFADPEDPSVIGPEGFERLCTAANIPLEGSLPLILAWQLGAKEMAKISKEEWKNGMASLKISSLPQLALATKDLENLLILSKPPLTKSGKKDHDPYDRTAYWSYVEDPKTAFQKLYMFCFALAKPEQSRNIDIETSTAFWSVLLVPKYPIMAEVLEFVKEKGTYRATNKDLWTMMLEFCVSVKPTLEDYEADGAWPTLLDDFVSWKKSNVGETAS